MILDTRLPGPPIGWPLLPVPGANGELGYPESLADSVRQQLQVILSTRPGEQLMRPGFGAGLTDSPGGSGASFGAQSPHDPGSGGAHGSEASFGSADSFSLATRAS